MNLVLIILFHLPPNTWFESRKIIIYIVSTYNISNPPYKFDLSVSMCWLFLPPWQDLLCTYFCCWDCVKRPRQVSDMVYFFPLSSFLWHSRHKLVSPQSVVLFLWSRSLLYMHACSTKLFRSLVFPILHNVCIDYVVWTLGSIMRGLFKMECTISSILCRPNNLPVNSALKCLLNKY